jgi:hypothetical protein
MLLSSVPIAALAQTEQRPRNPETNFPDIDSGVWAAESIYQLNERYGCLEGFPDGTFQGETALTRYQFAAGLYACLSNYDAEIQGRIDELVTKEDLAILFRVLSTLFEDATPDLEGDNFSTPEELQQPEAEEENLLPDPSETPSLPMGEPLPSPPQEIDPPMSDPEDSSSLPRDR